MKTMSIKFDESLVNELKKISEIFNISYSDFIRNAVKKSIEEKQKDFMYRMANVPYATDEEEKEIVSALSKLTNEDLEVVKIEEIRI